MIDQILERSVARSYLKVEWNKLFLLPFKDKTPEVRQRMRIITDKFVAWK